MVSHLSLQTVRCQRHYDCSPGAHTPGRAHYHKCGKTILHFRALSVADGCLPETGAVWNNTHSATLEDYKLAAAFDLFYTQDAIQADYKQLVRKEL